MVLYDPVTHILFDMDGTLLDTESIYTKMFSIIVKNYGMEFDEVEVHNKVAGTTELDSINIVIKECNLPCTTEEFQNQLLKLENEYLPEAKLKPGADKLINHFHKCNIPMAVATSSHLESVKLKLTKHAGLFQLLHHITCAANNPEVKAGKPAPDVFLLAASKFDDNPNPSSCLVFEDSRNGVLAGRRAGMQVVLIPEAGLPDDDTFLATVVLKSMEQFKPEMFGLPPFECQCKDNQQKLSTCSFVSIENAQNRVLGRREPDNCSCLLVEDNQKNVIDKCSEIPTINITNSCLYVDKQNP